MIISDLSTPSKISESSPLAPWLVEDLTYLSKQKGHAWLIQGVAGLGQYQLAIALARSWLCLNPNATGLACNNCSNCHQIDVHTCADLSVLMPEQMMIDLKIPLPEKIQTDLDKKQRKPSQEIRVEAIRAAIEFTQISASSQKGKLLLIYPAEKMNTNSANMLLKTLEEPTSSVRIVLASEAPHQLLPTIKSRCQSHTLKTPPVESSLLYLQQCGIPQQKAHTFVRFCGGYHYLALSLLEQGITDQQIKTLPTQLQAGNIAGFANYQGSDLVQTLLKICHDCLCIHFNANPRYFEITDLPHQQFALSTLLAWQRSLKNALRSANHPYNAPLMRQALISQGQAVLASGK